MKFALFATLLCLPVLTSCGPMVTVENVGVMTSAQRLIPIHQDASLRGGRVLGLLEGHSCKNNMWDPDPTRAAAEQQIRLQAARLGGNAIIAARYETRGVTVQPNCWSSITAYGTAIRIAE